MKDDKQINLQTPYKIKLPACTRKHLNINVTNTGKGNNRRWQATGGQRGQRANSAGRFRHGCTRKYTSRVSPSTSFAGPPRTERSPLPCGHLPTPWGVTPFRGGNIETPAPENTRISTSQIQARATTGVGKPQADSEGNERIPPDGFDMAALKSTLRRCCFGGAMWASPPTFSFLYPFPPQKAPSNRRVL